MIAAARYKRPDIFHNNLFPVELLALLQHYGIPNRLLDVTENALVALYFACTIKTEKGSENEVDGEVIVFKNEEIDAYTYPLIQAIADSYRLIGCNNCEITLEDFFKHAVDQPYFAEIKYLYDVWNSGNIKNDEHVPEWLKNPSEWIRANCQKPLFVYAPGSALSGHIGDPAFPANSGNIPVYSSR